MNHRKHNIPRDFADLDPEEQEVSAALYSRLIGAFNDVIMDDMARRGRPGRRTVMAGLYGFTAAALSSLEEILEAKHGAIADHYLRILLDDLIPAVKRNHAAVAEAERHGRRL
jgi:hypothetical protein